MVDKPSAQYGSLEGAIEYTQTSSQAGKYSYLSPELIYSHVSHHGVR